MKNFKLETFSANLGIADLMDFSETSNLNKMCSRFDQKLLNIIKTSAPKKALSNKEIKLKTKLWLHKKYYIKLTKKNKANQII